MEQNNVFKEIVSKYFSNGVENFNLQISEVQFIFKQDKIKKTTL